MVNHVTDASFYVVR